MGGLCSYVLDPSPSQVTDRESVSPSEYAAWESRMNDLEKTLQEERSRRHRYGPMTRCSWTYLDCNLG
jgi:hypothetical protein